MTGLPCPSPDPILGGRVWPRESSQAPLESRQISSIRGKGARNRHLPLPPREELDSHDPVQNGVAALKSYASAGC